jgi:hypothetical protein
MQYTIRFALKRDGEIIAQPRMTYSSRYTPAAVRDASSRRRACGQELAADGIEARIDLGEGCLR